MSPFTTARRHWGIQQRAMAPAGPLDLELELLSPLSLRYKARGAMRPRRPRMNEWACRTLNVWVAIVAIVLTAPLMLIVAAAVRLTSPGPAIYRQPRVGINRRLDRGPGSLNHRRSADGGGRVFTIYKFRTMRIGAGPLRQVWATQDDARVTVVGRFLRATRLDELPQFFNVLKGDMNIVGPRPEQPALFEELQEELGHYRRRQRVLPGITGLAQINAGYDTDLDGVRKKVKLDLEYIKRRSAARDLLIMAKTVPVMVLRKVWM